MAFGDVLAGLAEASHQHHTNLLQLDYQKRQKLAEAYGKLAEDESYPEEQRSESLKRALTLHTLPLGKKIPKEFESFSFTVKPRSAQEQQQPGLKGTGLLPQNLEIQGPSLTGTPPEGTDAGDAGPWMDPGGQVRPGATKQLQGPTFDIAAPPTAPPSMAQHEEQFGPMPFEERVRREREMTRAKTRPIPDKKIGQYPTVDEQTGEAKMVWVYQHIDPDTGSVSMWEEDAMGNLRPFAPRAATGARLSAEDATALEGAGLPAVINNPKKDPGVFKRYTDVAPGVTFVPIGSEQSGRFYVSSSPAGRPLDIGNVVYPFNPYGNQATGGVNTRAPLGVANTGTARQTPIYTGTDAQGNKIFDISTSTQQPNTPGAYPTPGQAPAPQPPPGAQQPQAGGEVDPAVIEDLYKRLEGIDLKGAALRLVAPGTFQPAPAGAPQGGPVAAPTAPPATAPQAVPRAGVNVSPQAKDPSVLNREAKVMLAVRPAAAMLFGSPDNPYLESLQSFAPLMDKADSRERVGNALRVILENLARVEKRTGGSDLAFSLLGGGVHIGGGELGGIIKNFMGIPQILASAETKVLEDTVKTMDKYPEEKRWLGRLIAAYGTIVGIRNITSASGLQFSADLMGKEIPVPGSTGVNDSKSYYNKLAQLAEELDRAISPMGTIPPEEKIFHRRNSIALAALGRGYDVRTRPDGSLLIRREDGRLYNEAGVRVNP